MLRFSCNGHHIITTQKIATTSLKKFFAENTDYVEIEQKDFITDDQDSINDTYTFIVRDPYKRYISGVAEIINESVIHGIPGYEKSKTLVVYDTKTKEPSSIYKTFNNLDFVSEKLDWLFNMARGDFTFGNDAHVINWLFNILIKICKGYSVEIVDINDLDSWIDLNFDVKLQHEYKKEKNFKNIVKDILEDNEKYNNLKYYLLSEINTYQWLTDPSFKNLSAFDRENKAKDLLIETVGNVFGHETFQHHHLIFFKEHIEFCNNLIEELEEI